MKFDRRSILAGASQVVLVGATAARASSAARTEQDGGSPALPPGWIGRTGRFNGVELHYVIAGSGPPVVLLHGWPQTWFAWRDTIAALAPRFTVIAPDLRGTGLSERTIDGYDKRTVAADIRDLIDGVAGGRASVVAHDMGGKAAYVLAHLYPDRVDRLVLVDCMIPGTENTDALRGGAWHYGFHMAPAFPEMLTQGRERDYIAAQIKAWSHRKDAIPEVAITEYARHYAKPGGMTAGFAYYRALPADAAFASTLSGQSIEAPLLAIGGRYGVRAKLAEALRSQARDLRSVIAENSGHFVAEEEPAFFQDQIIPFLIA